MNHYIFELKKCPKCGRFMMDENIKTADGWIIRWYCLCGYQEDERRNV